MLLAYRYPLVREGLKAVFEAHGHGRDRRDRQWTERCHSSHVCAQTYYIDVMMSGLQHGLEVTRQVRQRRPHTRVVLSTSANVTHVLAAMRYGAAGCLLQGKWQLVGGCVRWLPGVPYTLSWLHVSGRYRGREPPPDMDPVMRH